MERELPSSVAEDSRKLPGKTIRGEEGGPMREHKYLKRSLEEAKRITKKGGDGKGRELLGGRGTSEKGGEFGENRTHRRFSESKDF